MWTTLAFSMSFIALVTVKLINCGDDHEYMPEYPMNPSFRIQQMMLPQRAQRFRFPNPEDDKVLLRSGTSVGTFGQTRRNNRVLASGPQPPFVMQPPVPACAEYPTVSYCISDKDYPRDFTASCITSGLELFKKLRAKVQWNCAAFPDEMAMEEEATTASLTENPLEIIPPEQEVQGVPEPMRMPRVPTRTAIQPQRTRERLVAAPKPAPVRRVRDDSSGGLQTAGYSRLVFHTRSINHTYEVCPSVVKSPLGIVRAETETGEWKSLVQIGDCQQTIRAEECIRVGEPCEHLCSYLKSQCTQRYALQQMLTCSADRGLHLEWFKVPTSCGCQVEINSLTTTTPDPNSDR